MNSFNESSLRNFLTPLKDKYIHASNILTKLNDKKNQKEIPFLLDCAQHYKDYHAGFHIRGVNDIDKAVKVWNSYLNYVQQNSPFTAQSKFESTILEESIYRIFAGIETDIIKTGNIKAYSNLYFSPLDFSDFQTTSNVKINSKDQDFAIYKQVSIKVSDSRERIDTFVPVVAIECKTYLDKTMLEGSIATAEKIKNGNPFCRFCIVTEFYEVDKKVDVKHSRIDQIYVLNKDAKRKSGLSSIFTDVIRLLYQDTMSHLKRKWSDVEQSLKTKGVIL